MQNMRFAIIIKKSKGEKQNEKFWIFKKSL